MSKPDAAARDEMLSRELARALEHPIVARLEQRLLHLRPTEAPMQKDSRLAAVMAVLRVSNSNEHDAELLFIKRAVVARDPWSGHIAFPGGRHDVSDSTLEHTAIRETREEVSIDIGRYGRVIGQLDDLAPRSPRLPPIIVRPFVAVVPSSLEIERNHEVADAFWAPVGALSSFAAKAEYQLVDNGVASVFPAYAVREHVVWGLTERIVTQLLPLLQ